MGSCNGPWDAQFRGAEGYLDLLHPTCAEAVGWSYWGLAQLAAFNIRPAQVAVKFGRDERLLPFATTIAHENSLMQASKVDADMGIILFCFVLVVWTLISGLGTALLVRCKSLRSFLVILLSLDLDLSLSPGLLLRPRLHHVKMLKKL